MLLKQFLMGISIVLASWPPWEGANMFLKKIPKSKFKFANSTKKGGATRKIMNAGSSTLNFAENLVNFLIVILLRVKQNVR